MRRSAFDLQHDRDSPVDETPLNQHCWERRIGTSACFSPATWYWDCVDHVARLGPFSQQLAARRARQQRSRPTECAGPVADVFRSSLIVLPRCPAATTLPGPVTMSAKRCGSSGRSETFTCDRNFLTVAQNADWRSLAQSYR